MMWPISIMLSSRVRSRGSDRTFALRVYTLQQVKGKGKGSV